MIALYHLRDWYGNKNETTGAQGPLRVLSLVLCPSSALMKVLVLLKEIPVSRVRQVGIVLF